MQAVPTFYANIYVGLREGYSDIIHDISEVNEILQTQCNVIGLCVTVTPTTFIYKDGNEPGVIVGLINYPRFPDTSENILRKAKEIAVLCADYLNQLRVSIVTPSDTIMIESGIDV